MFSKWKPLLTPEPVNDQPEEHSLVLCQGLDAFLQPSVKWSANEGHTYLDTGDAFRGAIVPVLSKSLCPALSRLHEYTHRH